MQLSGTSVTSPVVAGAVTLNVTILNGMGSIYGTLLFLILGGQMVLH